MHNYNLNPASPDETIVHGACRPGYSLDELEAWMTFMTKQRIARVCCLLTPGQLDSFDDLLGAYRKYFGALNVCHAPINDFSLSDPKTLKEKILPFLLESEKFCKSVVVHCTAGLGRTGHVLASWLIHARDLPVNRALETVIQMGRNPYEAVFVGNASMEELIELLESVASD